MKIKVLIDVRESSPFESPPNVYVKILFGPSLEKKKECKTNHQWYFNKRIHCDWGAADIFSKNLTWSLNGREFANVLAMEVE